MSVSRNPFYAELVRIIEAKGLKVAEWRAEARISEGTLNALSQRITAPAAETVTKWADLLGLAEGDRAAFIGLADKIRAGRHPRALGRIQTLQTELLQARQELAADAEEKARLREQVRRLDTLLRDIAGEIRNFSPELADALLKRLAASDRPFAQ